MPCKPRLRERNSQLVVAIKEAHHRIKNNLQIVSALLELQLSEGSPQLPAKTIHAHLRQIKAISIIHNLLTPDTDFSAGRRWRKCCGNW